MQPSSSSPGPTFPKAGIVPRKAARAGAQHKTQRLREEGGVLAQGASVFLTSHPECLLEWHRATCWGEKGSHMTGDRLPRERGTWLGLRASGARRGESKQPVGRHRG